MTKDRGFLKIVTQHHAHLFFVVNPREWANVIIEFHQIWEVKVMEVTLGEKVACNAKFRGV
jgi:hypothetical protein